MTAGALEIVNNMFRYLLLILLCFIVISYTFINKRYRFIESNNVLIKKNDFNDFDQSFIHQSIVKLNNQTTLQQYIYNNLPEVKHTKVKQWLVNGLVTVNHIKIDYHGYILNKYDEIKILSNNVNNNQYIKSNKYNILYEDKHILIIDKFIIPRNPQSKQVDSILADIRLDRIKRGDKTSLYGINTISRATGIHIFAKSLETKDTLINEWNSYGQSVVCLLSGKLNPLVGSLSFLIDPNSYSINNSFSNKKVVNSISHYRTIQYNYNNYSLVEFSLETSYSNQIHIQLLDKDIKIIDYNSTDRLASRMIEYAYHITEFRLTHPITREQLTFTIDIPFIYKKYLEQLDDCDNSNGANLVAIESDNDKTKREDDESNFFNSNRNLKIISLDDYIKSSQIVKNKNYLNKSKSRS